MSDVSSCRALKVVLALIAAESLFAADVPMAGPVLTVPEGFTVEKAVGYPLLHRPIFASFDDDGNLYVGESSGENLKRDDMLARKPHWITKLIDDNGDGVFDRAKKFVDNITLPQGSLWYRGSVYAACPPSIWKFTDTDGDDVADQREEILTGFGFSGNACDTHGPFLSPTGRLYIVQGRHGHEFKDQDGHVISQGKAGRIYSCKLDGSDVRVHAGGGFDNPVEVDFTEEGECIGTVNILYRDRGDCLMHWVEGGVYPREDLADMVAEFKWTGGLLGPIHNLGHVACSGIMRYRGVHFGDDFRDRWFFTEFNTHKVRYAELKRAGSTFTADVHEFLTSTDGDFHPTDVLEDADGTLLVVDTGGWFLNGCPTSRVAKPEIYGGIYRVRKTNGVKVEDPRGKMLDLARMTPEQLIDVLDDPRPAVRQQAKILLSQLPLTEYFFAIRSDRQYSLRVRRHLIETSVMRQEPHWTKVDVLTDEPSLRVTANYASGEYQEIPPGNHPGSNVDETIFEQLFEILNRAQASEWERNPAVAFAALNSLSRLSTRMSPNLRQKWTSTLCDAVLTGVQSHPEDRLILHQAVTVLTRLRHADAMTKVLKSGSSRQKQVALIALDQMDNSPLTREMVIPLLSSSDARLQQTALEVIARHPGWGAETLSLLKTWVAEPEFSPERAQTLRGFLLGQQADPAVQAFLAETLANPATSAEVRGLLWDVLQRGTLATWPDAWQPLLRSALAGSDERATLAALAIIGQRSLAGYDEPLRALIQNPKQPLSVRAEAVSSLAPNAEPLSDDVLELLIGGLWGSQYTSQEAAAAARAIGNGPWTSPQLITLAGKLGSPRAELLSIQVKAFARSSEPKVGAAFVAALLKLPAAENLAPDELAGILRKYPEAVQSAAKPLFDKLGVDPAAQAARLAELEPLLTGGDAKSGRLVFFSKKAACSACHAVANEGGRIGPHLTTIGASRSPKDLLEAIVYPSASFVNGYRPYVAMMDDGKVHQGVISAESPESITLKTQDLQELLLRREAIAELKEGTTSIMPKGLDTQLSPQELRDLLAYLQGRK